MTSRDLREIIRVYSDNFSLKILENAAKKGTRCIWYLFVTDGISNCRFQLMDGSCSIARHGIISRRMWTVSTITWSKIYRNLKEAAVHQKDSLGRDIVLFE